MPHRHAFFSKGLRNLRRHRRRLRSVPLGPCLPSGFFPVLWILCEHLGRRDGIANQRGLFQSESSWCCWPVSELTSTSRACAGSGGRNIIGGAHAPLLILSRLACPTSTSVRTSHSEPLSHHAYTLRALPRRNWGTGTLRPALPAGPAQITGRQQTRTYRRSAGRTPDSEQRRCYHRRSRA